MPNPDNSTKPVVIRAQGVSKRFVINRSKSLKEKVVRASDSKKHRKEFWALKDVDLEIRSGSTIGLIGHNGSGKSTLLKMIGGIMQPDAGSVAIRGRIAALLELGAGFHPDLTGRENVYLNAAVLGLTRSQTDELFDDIVAFSGIAEFIDTQVKFYSSGMYVRLAFAVAVHTDPDILLVDEVLAVGDEPFQRKCIDRIRQFQKEGRTIVLVTHSMEVVADMCDRAIVLDHGKVISDGKPSDALRALRTGFEQARIEEQAKQQPKNTDEVAVISELRLLDSDGIENNQIESGQGLILRAKIKTKQPFTGASLKVWISSSYGVGVFDASTRRLGVEIPDFTDEVTVDLNFGSLPLNSGQYSITADLEDADSVLVSRISDGPSFYVLGAPDTGGFVKVPVLVDVQKA